MPLSLRVWLFSGMRHLGLGVSGLLLMIVVIVSQKVRQEDALGVGGQ